MENKEIYIDGVNVAECPHRKKEVTFMNVIKCYNYGACEGVNCLYKQLKRKEQECEEFRKANDEKNELLAKLGCPTIATAKRKVFCLQEQLDQLKKSNEELKNIIKSLQNK